VRAKEDVLKDENVMCILDSHTDNKSTLKCKFNHWKLRSEHLIILPKISYLFQSKKGKKKKEGRV
jgi:hypothetical protein